MSNARRNNLGIVFIGAERSGKSYMAKGLIEEMLKNLYSIPVVYNFGMNSDFPSNIFEEVEFLKVVEHRKYMNKNDYKNFLMEDDIRYFRVNSLTKKGMRKGLNVGSVYRFSRFCEMFRGLRVRAWRVSEPKSERRLFNSFSNYLSECSLLLDDCRAIYRYGMKAEHINLYSRKNHVGKKSTHFKMSNKTGVDIFSVFHSIDLVPPEILTYSNKLVFFETSSMPTLKNVEDIDLKKCIENVWRKLKKSPKYSCYSIGLKGEDYLSINKIQ